MHLNNKENHLRPRNWLINEEYFKKRSFFLIALICLLTLIVHGIIFYSFNLLKKDRDLLSKSKEIKPDYELVYYEDPQMRFVETNTELEPQAPPQDTVNFAAQSQQASQMNPSLNPDEDFPTLEGPHEIFSKIVQGSLAVSEERMEQHETMVAQNDNYKEEVAREAFNEFEVRKRPKPKARPKLNQSMPGPIKKNDGAVSKFGLTAVNARFTEFGMYVQKMFESIQYQCAMLFENYSPSASDSYVVVEYGIDENGNVISIGVPSAKASNLAIILAKDAILSQAPFGPWTEDMKVILSKEEKFTFILH